MARNRRRKRAQQRAETLEPAQHQEAPRSLEPVDQGSDQSADQGSDQSADQSASQEPRGDAPPAQAEDHSCLIHNSLNLDTNCDRCGALLCQMCACPHRAEVLCAECLEGQGRRRREGGVWRGLTALGLGLVALAVVTAPLAFTMDGEAVAAMPGGRTFLIYGPLLMGVLGVVVGASAQDFAGLTRRAGLVGMALCTLSILFILLLNLSKALG
jgi:hypothetical protein